jgi:isocitrate dehydrogenase kinase/phosphatase
MQNLLFTSTRSTFQTDTGTFRELVDFLEQIAPHQGRPALLAAIGFVHPAKILLNQQLRRHLASSGEVFVVTPGRHGRVMAVFGLPTFPYVLKVVRDRSDKQTFVSREQVMQRYELVHETDRVGRMLDPWVYTNLRFRRRDFEESLLAELLTDAPSSVAVDGDDVLLRHVYVQRRVVPLQIYLKDGTVPLLRKLSATYDYGQAIKDLLAAGIVTEYAEFNFGVTPEGRVVLYDFDDLEPLGRFTIQDLPDYEDETELPELLRTMPHPPGRENLFPEMYEYEAPMLVLESFRQAFTEKHGDLFTTAYWRRVQAEYAEGIVADLFPYPNERRLEGLRREAGAILGPGMQSAVFEELIEFR